MKAEEVKTDLVVYYIPQHCRSGKTKEGWMKGKVAYVKDSKFAFVKYYYQSSGLIETNAKLTAIKDIFPADAPWIKNIPVKNELQFKDLEQGQYYVPRNGTEYILKFGTLDDPLRASYICITYKTSYPSGSFNHKDFPFFREATAKEIKYFEECKKAGRVLTPPVDLRD